MIGEWQLAAAIAARHPDHPFYRIFVRDFVVAAALAQHQILVDGHEDGHDQRRRKDTGDGGDDRHA